MVVIILYVWEFVWRYCVGLVVMFMMGEFDKVRRDLMEY